MATIEQELEAIERQVERQVQEIADEYRRSVVIPICHEHDLSYTTGNGVTWFNRRRGGETIDDQHMAVLEDMPFLVPVFEKLNLPVLGSGVMVLGYYVENVPLLAKRGKRPCSCGVCRRARERRALRGE